MTDTFNTTDDDEINLLDLLLVVVQNLRLLVLGPLTVGLLALGVSYLLPPTYESAATQSGDAQLVAMYNSAQVLDAVIDKVGYSRPGEDKDTARQRLAKDLKVSFNPFNKTINIVTSAPSPVDAQRLAQEAIKQVAVLNQSRLEDIKRMNEQYELAVRREREYASAAERVTQQMASKAAVNQIVLAKLKLELLDAAKEAQIRTAGLANSLREQENFQLLQNPTLPTKKIASKMALIAIIATLASAFALLLFVFVKRALVNASRDAESAAKMKLLKNSWLSAVGRSNQAD